MSCPLCPVLSAISCLTFAICPAMSCLQCSVCHVLSVLPCLVLSYPGLPYPVCHVLSALSCLVLSYPGLPTCPAYLQCLPANLYSMNEHPIPLEYLVVLQVAS
jgi:hypothetical protein